MSKAYRRYFGISLGAIDIFIDNNQVDLGRYFSFVGSVHGLLLITVPMLHNKRGQIRVCLGLLDFLENLWQV